MNRSRHTPRPDPPAGNRPGGMRQAATKKTMNAATGREAHRIPIIGGGARRRLVGPHWSKGWIIENNVISHSVCSGISLGGTALARGLADRLGIDAAGPPRRRGSNRFRRSGGRGPAWTALVAKWQVPCGPHS
jgi:hypothetical protein